MIISARLKCTGCGKIWTQLINDQSEEWKDRQTSMRAGHPIDSTCEPCEAKSK